MPSYVVCFSSISRRFSLLCIGGWQAWKGNITINISFWYLTICLSNINVFYLLCNSEWIKISIHFTKLSNWKRKWSTEKFHNAAGDRTFVRSFPILWHEWTCILKLSHKSIIKARNQDCYNTLPCCNINRDFHGFFNDLKNANTSSYLSKWSTFIPTLESASAGP